MEVCPNCHRRLISHASARCNWCGHLIEDTQYQEHAATNRQAFFAEAALHDAQSLARQLNSTGGPFGDPIFGMPAEVRSAAAQLAAIRARREMQNLTPPPKTEPAPALEDLPDDDQPPANRFGHLEIE
jgi:hypothetical protein